VYTLGMFVRGFEKGKESQAFDLPTYTICYRKE
jgi:hypothetical protein